MPLSGVRDRFEDRPTTRRAPTESSIGFVNLQPLPHFQRRARPDLPQTRTVEFYRVLTVVLQDDPVQLDQYYPSRIGKSVRI
jgi:hypothetical protein